MSLASRIAPFLRGFLIGSVVLWLIAALVYLGLCVVTGCAPRPRPNSMPWDPPMVHVQPIGKPEEVESLEDKAAEETARRTDEELSGVEPR